MTKPAKSPKPEKAALQKLYIKQSKSIRDRKDGDVGKIWYEINLNHYFYKYVLSRHFEEIEADINRLEKEIIEMIKEI